MLVGQTLDSTRVMELKQNFGIADGSNQTSQIAISGWRQTEPWRSMPFMQVF